MPEAKKDAKKVVKKPAAQKAAPAKATAKKATAKKAAPAKTPIIKEKLAGKKKEQITVRPSGKAQAAEMMNGL